MAKGFTFDILAAPGVRLPSLTMFSLVGVTVEANPSCGNNTAMSSGRYLKRAGQMSISGNVQIYVEAASQVSKYQNRLTSSSR